MEKGSNLDTLLDEALDDFLQDAPASSIAPSKEKDESIADSTLDSNEGPTESQQSGREKGTSKPGKLAFDPLAARRGSKANKTKPKIEEKLFNQLNDVDKANDSNLEDLSEGLAQLFEELAQSENSIDQSSKVPSDTAGNLKRTEADAVPEHGIAATLQKLAANASEFPSGKTSEDDDLFESEVLKQLASQLEGLGASDGSNADDVASLPGMASFVDSIMHQLLSKEVLYQPMKDIGAKYPEWLELKQSSLSAEDLQRYNEQYQYIQAIVELYEKDPSNYTKLVELLQEMQQRGQPPQEIIDELAPGMSFGPDGIPEFGGGHPSNMPDDCALQ